MSDITTNDSLSNAWLRVTRSEPCPICGKPDWCGVLASGEVVHCMRVESTHECKGGGWVHRLREPLPPRPAPPPIEKKPDWTPECRAMFEHPQAEGKRIELAKVLGVAVEALGLLRVGVGWDDWRFHRPFSSWPSRDADGHCVGYTRRYSDVKRTNRGGSNGLFYCHGWDRHPGPILIVEGGSDVAACESAGIGAIGRPSNIGGVKLLRSMLCGVDLKRVLVVGEHDEAPERRGQVSSCSASCCGCAYCWPGWFGMQKVARELRCRGVMVPAGFKDVRELYQAGELINWVEALR